MATAWEQARGLVTHRLHSHPREESQASRGSPALSRSGVETGSLCFNTHPQPWLMVKVPWSRSHVAVTAFFSSILLAGYPVPPA